MISIDTMIAISRKVGASDIHFHEGMLPIIRKNGMLEPMPDSEPLSNDDIKGYADAMLGKKKENAHYTKQDVDFCYTAADQTRQRVNLFQQNEKMSVAIRLLNDRIPTIDELKLPPVLHKIAEEPRGLVLVTGPTGSGKSTTLASVIDEINRTRRCHILTLEDPVEYKYEVKNSLINQREIGVDVENFAVALRSALREDPDVILVGEMRDLETISAALTAAETGHLVFSTLHTIGAANTVDRMIDAFPAAQQQQIRVQLAAVLKGVITQQLIPREDVPGRIAATEVMLSTDGICNLIRENKLHQINSSLQTGGALGMHTLNASLVNLVKQRMIKIETAISYSSDKEDLIRMLR